MTPPLLPLGQAADQAFGLAATASVSKQSQALETLFKASADAAILTATEREAAWKEHFELSPASNWIHTLCRVTELHPDQDKTPQEAIKEIAKAFGRSAQDAHILREIVYFRVKAREPSTLTGKRGVIGYVGTTVRTSSERAAQAANSPDEHERYSNEDGTPMLSIPLAVYPEEATRLRMERFWFFMFGNFRRLLNRMVPLGTGTIEWIKDPNPELLSRCKGLVPGNGENRVDAFIGPRADVHQTVALAYGRANAIILLNPNFNEDMSSILDDIERGFNKITSPLLVFACSSTTFTTCFHALCRLAGEDYLTITTPTETYTISADHWIQVPLLTTAYAARSPSALRPLLHSAATIQLQTQQRSISVRRLPGSGDLAGVTSQEEAKEFQRFRDLSILDFPPHLGSPPDVFGRENTRGASLARFSADGTFCIEMQVALENGTPAVSIELDVAKRLVWHTVPLRLALTPDNQDDDEEEEASVAIGETVILTLQWVEEAHQHVNLIIKVTQPTTDLSWSRKVPLQHIALRSDQVAMELDSVWSGHQAAINASSKLIATQMALPQDDHPQTPAAVNFWQSPSQGLVGEFLGIVAQDGTLRWMRLPELTVNRGSGFRRVALEYDQIMQAVVLYDEDPARRSMDSRKSNIDMTLLFTGRVSKTSTTPILWLSMGFLNTMKAAEQYQQGIESWHQNRLHWSKYAKDKDKLGAAGVILDLVESIAPGASKVPDDWRLSHLLQFEEEDELLGKGGLDTLGRIVCERESFPPKMLSDLNARFLQLRYATQMGPALSKSDRDEFWA